MTSPDLPEALAWLDYCLCETAAALAVAKEAALAAMRGGEPVTPTQFAAMCEASAGIITLRGVAAREFQASCPLASDPRVADET